MNYFHPRIIADSRRFFFRHNPSDSEQAKQLHELAQILQNLRENFLAFQILDYFFSRRFCRFSRLTPISFILNHFNPHNLWQKE